MGGIFSRGCAWMSRVRRTNTVGRVRTLIDWIGRQGIGLIILVNLVKAENSRLRDGILNTYSRDKLTLRILEGK